MTRRAIRLVPVGAIDPRRFGEVLDAEGREGLDRLLTDGPRALRGHVVYNVNSTARGGGVAEMLRSLVGYARGGGVDARWKVISGTPEFFALTKRLHNRLHGAAGDDGTLGPADRELYERSLEPAARSLGRLVRPADIVMLHDPQTAGLVEPMLRTGATVIWRCHVGVDDQNDLVREAQAFLLDYVSNAHALIFSRRSFAWEGVPDDRVVVIPPSIDAFSPKNTGLSPANVIGILHAAQVLADHHSGDSTFTRSDGTPGRVDRAAHMVEDEPLQDGDRVVTQVSRFDRLKDPFGVMKGFAAAVAPAGDAHLLIAGPSTEGVSDDPEGGLVWTELCAQRAGLAPDARRLVHLAALPMDDTEENAVIVNAIQRHSEVIVQKSLAEGFGLTVAEAMWKGRPVAASRIGGIQEQIDDGENGILLEDPRDTSAFGRAVRGLLDDPARAERMGAAAHERVRHDFLGPRHLEQYLQLFAGLLRNGHPAPHFTATRSTA